jgi:hypothetical protein
VVKDENCDILHVNEQVVRWSKCFELLLNVEDDRKANLMSMARGGTKHEDGRTIGN